MIVDCTQKSSSWILVLVDFSAKTETYTSTTTDYTARDFAEYDGLDDMVAYFDTF